MSDRMLAPLSPMDDETPAQKASVPLMAGVGAVYLVLILALCVGITGLTVWVSGWWALLWAPIAVLVIAALVVGVVAAGDSADQLEAEMNDPTPEPMAESGESTRIESVPRPYTGVDWIHVDRDTIVRPDAVVRVTRDGEGSRLHMTDGTSVYSSLPLGTVHRQLSSGDDTRRVLNRSRCSR